MQESAEIKRQWSGMSKSRIDSIKRIWDSLWGIFWAAVFSGWSSTLQSTLLNRRYADRWTQSNVIIYSGAGKKMQALVWWTIAYLHFKEPERQRSARVTRSIIFPLCLHGEAEALTNSECSLLNVSFFNHTRGEDYLNWLARAFRADGEI